jgi:hypothetical protein
VRNGSPLTAIMMSSAFSTTGTSRSGSSDSAEHSRRAPALHEIAQRRPPRQQVRPLTRGALELARRNARVLEKLALDVLLAQPGPRQRLGQDRAQHQQRTLSADGHATAKMTSQATIRAMPSARYGIICSRAPERSPPAAHAPPRSTWVRPTSNVGE